MIYPALQKETRISFEFFFFGGKIACNFVRRGEGASTEKKKHNHHYHRFPPWPRI
jgi:hypothetical protein